MEREREERERERTKKIRISYRFNSWSNNSLTYLMFVVGSGASCVATDCVVNKSGNG
jgi:hypothetical protein